MGGNTRKGRGSVQDQRRELAERLRDRSGELEDAIFDRICALDESLSGHHQLQGLRRVIRPAVEHGLTAVELGEHRAPEPPPELIAHARKAAWRPVSLPALLEHYLAGYSVFQQFLLRESPSVEPARQAQASLDVVFHRLRRVLSDEHTRELQKRNRSSDLRKLERVQELLSGEIQEAPDLEYPVGGTHVGIVASGPEIATTIRRLFQPLGSPLLVVRPIPHAAWAWVSTRDIPTVLDLDATLGPALPTGTCIAMGEPAIGLCGWRRTHGQAKSAFPIAQVLDGGRARYGEVALLASFVRDDLLKEFLRRLYLAPLERGRNNAPVLRHTLRQYFKANKNGVSAAAALGVTRQTITNRLQVVEDRLNRPLDECAPSLEAALQLEELGFIDSR